MNNDYMSLADIKEAEEILEDARDALQSEIDDGHLNFGECGVDTFVLWYRWKMATDPDFGGTLLSRYDMMSAEIIFELWVKSKRYENQ